MAIDDRRRLELADVVKRTMGDEAGLTLMEMLPPVGWADVATKQDLDGLRVATKADVGALHREMNQRFEVLHREMNQRFESFDSRMNQRFESFEHTIMGAFHKEMTAQTWRLVTAATAMFGLFAAVVRL